MRKCAACGYLLLGDGDRCNHCGEALPRAGVAAAPAAAPAVQPPPAPAAPPPAPRFSATPPPAAPRTASPPRFAAAPLPSPYGPPPAAPPERQVWYPDPIITTAPAPKSATPYGKLVIVAVVVLALFGGYTFVKQQANKVPAGTEEFANGNGFTYDSPDGLYSAQMPVAPSVQHGPLGSVGGSMAVAYARDTADQWEMLTGSAILPGTVSDADADRFFDQAGAEIASGSASGEVDVTKSKRTTRGGMPALDLWLKDTNGAPGRMRIMLWGPKLYMYGVFATRGTDRLFHALDDSFVAR